VIRLALWRALSHTADTFAFAGERFNKYVASLKPVESPTEEDLQSIAILDQVQDLQERVADLEKRVDVCLVSVRTKSILHFQTLNADGYVWTMTSKEAFHMGLEPGPTGASLPSKGDG
jgi:hypothetical protein